MISSSRARIVYLCDFNAHGGTQTALVVKADVQGSAEVLGQYWRPARLFNQ